MTRKEMAELFGVMMLAWPNAEMFKGGIEKLGPTIELWTACNADVDFWTGQRAVLRLCQTCKFPPAIAEFKEQSEKVKSELYWQIRGEWDRIKFHLDIGKDAEEEFQRLPRDSYSRLAIEAIGGPKNLIITRMSKMGDGGEKEFTCYNYDGFATAYEKLVRKELALPGRQSKALPAARKEEL